MFVENQLIRIKLNLLTRTITIESPDGAYYSFQKFSTVKIDETEITVEFCHGGPFTYLRAECVKYNLDGVLWKIVYIC